MMNRKIGIMMASLAFALVGAPSMAQEIAQATDRLVVHTPATKGRFKVWDDMGYLQLSAPKEPQDAYYSLHEIISCRPGYTPIAAWHEKQASYPSIDVLYTVNLYVEDGKVMIHVRTRANWSERIGYVYVDVFAWCQKV